MDRGARVRVLDPEKRGGKWSEEEQVGVVLACLASEGAGSAWGERGVGGMAPVLATVATVEKTTHRYYRRRLTGSTGEPKKIEKCYFIWALEQPQKFYKNLGRLLTR